LLHIADVQGVLYFGVSLKSLPAASSKKVIPIAVFVVPFLVLGGLVAIFALHSHLSQEEQTRLDRADIEKIEHLFQSGKKPVDVATLEREGLSKCDEGLALIQSLQAHPLVDRQKFDLRTDLLKGKNLILEGLDLFNRADVVSGRCYDVAKYQAALKTARQKLAELPE
jgi:hypothetical protein